ncbi:hypothetical protein GCM10009785_32230 [Brooklawnia cerclae]
MSQMAHRHLRRPVALLASFHQHPRCRFWPDSVSYSHIDLDRVRAHRQVTDAYLVGLAAHHDAKVATFDADLAAEHPERTVLLSS